MEKADSQNRRAPAHSHWLDIHAVDQISEKEISNRDAKLAGFESRAELLADLKLRDAARQYWSDLNLSNNAYRVL